MFEVGDWVVGPGKEPRPITGRDKRGMLHVEGVHGKSCSCASSLDRWPQVRKLTDVELVTVRVGGKVEF